MTLFALVGYVIAGFIGYGSVRGGTEVSALAFVLASSAFVIISVGIGYLTHINPVQIMGWFGIISISLIVYITLFSKK